MKFGLGGETARGESFALKSNNSAETWERIIIPREPFTASVNDIAIDPVTDGTVYFAMGNMILKSIDAGQAWQIVLNKGLWLSINPRNNKELCVIGPKLFRTIDGGQSWYTMLPPTERRSVWTLAVDWDKKIVYAGTSNPEYGVYKLYY